MVNRTFNETIAELNILSSYNTEPKKRQKYKDCINDMISDRESIIADLKHFYKDLYIKLLELEYEQNTAKIQGERVALAYCFDKVKEILSKLLYNKINKMRLDEEMLKELKGE